MTKVSIISKTVFYFKNFRKNFFKKKRAICLQENDDRNMILLFNK